MDAVFIYIYSFVRLFKAKRRQNTSQNYDEEKQTESHLQHGIQALVQRDEGWNVVVGVVDVHVVHFVPSITGIWRLAVLFKVQFDHMIVL